MTIRELEFGDVDIRSLDQAEVQRLMQQYITALSEKPGNAPEYDVSTVEANPDSPLKGKKIIFFGSSVVLGSNAFNQSFADFLQAEDGIEIIKEAINGTSMVDEDQMGASYVKRIRTVDPSFPADAFFCQLSTNDATQNKPLGEIAEGKDPESFDTLTITGAMEYLICYAQTTWKCPVFFFTGTPFVHPLYEQMVDRLLALKEKWGIEVLDLWNDPEIREISDEDYDLYMTDPIHPTKAGYRCWWAPKFRAFLTEKLV